MDRAGEQVDRGASRPLLPLFLGPALALFVLLLGPGEDPRVARMAAVAVWMASWWVTEAIPIPATALIPLAALPVFGIEALRSVAARYSSPVIYLFLGGFLLALGLQASGMHRRYALFIIQKMGGQPRRVVLGFMLSAGFLSMWISNTASVMVLLPVGLSVITAAKERGVESAVLGRFATCVMLGIAYAGNIGGMATLVGTPPNLVYKEQLTQLFPGAPSPSFLEWMLFGLPMAALFLFLGWLLLTRVLFRVQKGALLGSAETVRGLRKELGPLRRDEKLASLIFGLTALLWITRKGIDIGATRIPGWGSLTVFEKGFVDDSVVAIAMSLLLFLIPSSERKGERLLEWRMTKDLPWGMLLLFGGGFALAGGFQSSGLSVWLGEQLEVLSGTSPYLVLVVVCVSVTFLTELTSNTATTQMLLPVLASAALSIGCDPRVLMVPATISASCAFMMPVASPTQAIVFASGYVPIRQMLRAGILFNLIGVILVILSFLLFAEPSMSISMDGIPAWAQKH